MQQPCNKQEVVTPCATHVLAKSPHYGDDSLPRSGTSGPRQQSGQAARAILDEEPEGRRAGSRQASLSLPLSQCPDYQQGVATPCTWPGLQAGERHTRTTLTGQVYRHQEIGSV